MERYNLSTDGLSLKHIYELSHLLTCVYKNSKVGDMFLLLFTGVEGLTPKQLKYLALKIHKLNKSLLWCIVLIDDYDEKQELREIVKTSLRILQSIIDILKEYKKEYGKI